MERYRLLIERYRTLPLLAIEDAAAGTQLLDTMRDCWPQVPVIALPHHRRIMRESKRIDSYVLGLRERMSNDLLG